MGIKSIRGATTADANTETDILSATKQLLQEIMLQNQLNAEQVISIIFSCTDDLTAAYPAKAARSMGFCETSLLCLQEMKVQPQTAKMCIRVLMHVQTDKPITFCYLKNTQHLRSN